MEDQLRGPPKKINPSPMMMIHHFNRHAHLDLGTMQNMGRAAEPGRRLTRRCGVTKTTFFLEP